MFVNKNRFFTVSLAESRMKIINLKIVFNFISVSLSFLRCLYRYAGDSKYISSLYIPEVHRKIQKCLDSCYIRSVNKPCYTTKNILVPWNIAPSWRKKVNNVYIDLTSQHSKPRFRKWKYMQALFWNSPQRFIYNELIT